jgi:transcriptional regulator with XRE-family HTH domain
MSIDIGKRLKGLRRGQRYTLKELANRSGVAQSTLTYIETSSTSPTVETMGRITSFVRGHVCGFIISFPMPTFPYISRFSSLFVLWWKVAVLA